ncbi:hypothetical protein O6H91_15G029200 [Diphasiastrum complanatum]|uniref:Uncharacterized protein n=1 Tax=Diphasiastrum complanatum TaxID=34168 RepID=A0ACC2BHQ4_DIPCM|nr:hypothetical protein O6H91_15G029200 [Diphasiastrum complanatum]
MQALEKVELASNGPLCVADLGCSSGPNTLSVVGGLPFFSDLPSNDFNTLFCLFPPYISLQLAITSANDLNKRSYFAVGVQGACTEDCFQALPCTPYLLLIPCTLCQRKINHKYQQSSRETVRYVSICS